jgi:flagellar capping protein FliD
MNGIGSLNTSPLSSAAGIETLIQQMTVVQREPLKRLTTLKDDLTIRSAIYDDIKSKLDALRTANKELMGESDVFTKRTSTSSDAKVGSISTTGSPGIGQYSLTVNRLAQGHRILSNRQAQSDVALGMSGSFVVGGAAARTVSNGTTVTDTVNAFSTVSTIRTGEKELGNGRYFVEVRNEGTPQFRLVDENGEAVRIASGSGNSMTNGWQDLSKVAGRGFDTGRGLQINFGNGPYTTGLKGSGAAAVDFTAQGPTIPVTAGSSLNSIRDAINTASYADGNQVSASIVDHTLILTSARTGSSSRIALADSSGSVLSSLGLMKPSATEAESLATDKGATAFGTGALASFVGGGVTGQSALAAGRYHVEIGSGANASKFRLLDATGNPVAIASSSGGNTATTGWVGISDGVYDTGRGLTVTFQGNGTYSPTTFGSSAASAYFDTLQTSQSPRDASFSLNGQTLTRARNTGLNDVVEGLSFSLQGTGTTQVKVNNDNDGVVTRAKTMVTKLNDLLAYLRAKTESTKDEKASTPEKPVYKAGTLAGDTVLNVLRRSLASDLLNKFPGAAEGAPSRLSELGITLSKDGLSFEVSDQEALKSALSKDFTAVSKLFDHVTDKVEARLTPFLEGENAAITRSKKTMTDQLTRLDERIKTTEGRIKSTEDTLRKQFQGMQGQITQYQNENQQVQLLLATSMFSQQY